MKYLALLGSSTTIIEADTADGAREQILINQGLLKDLKNQEARREQYATIRKTKPYLWENITVRPATQDDLRRYAAIADVTSAPKGEPKKPRQKPRKTVNDRLFGEAS